MLHGGQEGIENHLLAADADRHLLGLVVEAVFALELRHDGLAQRRCSLRRGVFGLAAVDRGLSFFLDVVGRVEVGLAGAEADDVQALRFKLGRFRGHRDGRRRLNGGQALGENRHGGLLW